MFSEEREEIEIKESVDDLEELDVNLEGREDELFAAASRVMKIPVSLWMRILTLLTSIWII